MSTAAPTAAHPKPAPPKPTSEYSGIAAQLAAAKKRKAAEEALSQSRDARLKQKTAQQAREFKWMHGLVVLLLLCFVYLHIAGLYLFTRGFLLTRLVLEDKSECAVSPTREYGDAVRETEDGCWHPRMFEKAVVVIIDALRYDFTVPYEGADPQPFHNAFTTPYRHSVAHPENSVLFKFLADPPTTTLQRLKGLTTGSLPTFMDAGSNFAGDHIDEDNVIAQLHALGKRVVLLGDDTWMALFANYLDKNLTRPYESLNVWDLHTVDNGVNEHIFPLLKKDAYQKWDVLIGHYLGVDHAGHRYGPNHPAMTEKLLQMNGIVERLMEMVDESTLLVVMGDHGMDAKGDHGGESQSELEAALWMYSKKPLFGKIPEGDGILPPGFGSDDEGDRWVAQIDLVPTLSLLMGAPIPYNNLGAVIPEAFVRKGWQNLVKAARLTAAQIRRYQRRYAGEEEDLNVDTKNVNVDWVERKGAFKEWEEDYLQFASYQMKTLSVYKSLWAKFDLVSMGAGIAVLAGSVVMLLVYRNFSGDILELTDTLLTRIRNGLAIGTLGGLGLSRIVEQPLPHVFLFTTAIGVLGGFLSAAYYARRRCNFSVPGAWNILAIVFTILNCVMFGSNSFTIWEDKTLTFFISTFAVAGFLGSLRNPDAVQRVLGTYHSTILLVLSRVSSLSRLCREEQIPYCKSTFYASDTSSVSAPWTLLLLYVTAIALPALIRSFYTGTRSFNGPAPVYISWAFRFGLFLSAVYWTLDSADNASWFGAETSLTTSKIVIAQIVLGLSLIAGVLGYGYNSLCLGVEVAPTTAVTTNAPLQTDSSSSVLLLGYANLFGTGYLFLVLTTSLSLLLLQKPLGALSLALLLWQLLSVLEILDTVNLATSAIGPVIFGILGNSHFFSTGHQATLSAIQWESAFIPIASVRYPWSPLLVVANTLGPQILTALAVPLVALWKKPPRRGAEKGERLLGRAVKAAVVFLCWHAVLALASTICAGWLRRHLMLYRIFSPRFMLGAVTLVVVDFVVVLAAVGGVRWNMLAVGEVFGME